MKHEIKLLPSYWASVSGGKDSFYMLKMILNSKKYILNGVVHFELEIDYPFIKNVIYPLVENGIVEENILEWAKQQDIYNDYYKYNDRCGCMGCPMSTLKEGVYLKRYYPKEFNYFYKKMIETEKKVSKEKGQKFSIWGNSKYDTEYRIKRINNIINYDQVDIFRYLNNLDKEG